MFDFLKKFLASSNEGELRKIQKIVNRINQLEPDMQKLTDEQMREKLQELRRRAQSGTDLDELLPETYALSREAAVRVLGQRPFDVQLIGAIVLHQGRIAEMKTGEGKTLIGHAARHPERTARQGRAYRHCKRLSGALRRREWMGKVYRFLGLTRRPDRA